MEFQDYQERGYVAIQPHTDEKDTVLNWMVGLSEEVGEVAKHIKHKYYGNEPFTDEEIASELGDVQWYLMALCTSLGISLDTVAAINLAKLEYRFGGKDFSEEASKNRHANEKKFNQTEMYAEMIKNLRIIRLKED